MHLTGCPLTDPTGFLIARPDFLLLNSVHARHLSLFGLPGDHARGGFRLGIDPCRVNFLPVRHSAFAFACAALPVTAAHTALMTVIARAVVTVHFVFTVVAHPAFTGAV